MYDLEYGLLEVTGKDQNWDKIKCDRIALTDKAELLFVSMIADSGIIKGMRGSLSTNKNVTISYNGPELTDGNRKSRSYFTISKLECGYRDDSHRIGYGMVHAFFFTRLDGILLNCDDDHLWAHLRDDRYTTPIVRDWMPWIRQEMVRKNYLRQAVCFGCNVARVVMTPAQLDEIVAEGVKTSQLVFPSNGVAGRISPPNLEGVNTLDTYLMRYGKLLGLRAAEMFNPIYMSGRDQSLDLSFVSAEDPNRVPYSSQANVINAVSRAWFPEKSLIICGEMGTGKTLLGAAAVHAHALQAQGKRTTFWREKEHVQVVEIDGQPICIPIMTERHEQPTAAYRALIMCPNHLIDKWEREILLTCPGAKVYKFERSDPNRADDSYMEVCRYINERRGGSRWLKPNCPEWVIVGRNQSKQMPDWQHVTEREFKTNPGITATGLVHSEPLKDDNERPVIRDGEVVMVNTYDKVVRCPRCGANHGRPGYKFNATDKKAKMCGNLYLKEVGFEDRKGGGGLDVIWELPDEFDKKKPGDAVKYNGRVYRVRKCGEPLWQWAPQPRKWAPANLFHKQGRKMFDYFILDEMHEEKEAGSGQAIAAGKLMKSGKKLLGLTGTLIGGYAHHLFPLLFRMAPRSLVREGFRWGGVTPFVERYGRIDTVVTTKLGSEIIVKSGGREKGGTSLRREFDGDRRERQEIKPGVSPTFFGNHLIEKAVFISLDEMHDDLPYLVDDDRSLIAVPMEEPMASAYDDMQRTLLAENAALLRKGNSKLLSVMLHTLLEYPDKPFDWYSPWPDTEAVGWFEDAKNKTLDSFNPVWQPDNLDPSVLYPKEQALYDLCMEQKARGRKVWVYCTQTGKRDVQSRLAGILKRGGLSVKVMRSSQVDTYSRERWIAENGPGLDVIISHPELVATGLDFFDKARTFNFCTIAFYEGDYRVNLIRQSGRRHWRIGQWEECETYYLYYQGTMQERQVAHVGEKLAAAKNLEGKFSAEGLATISSGGSPMMEMAKSLDKAIDDPRANWAKLRDETKARLVRMQRDGSLGALAAAVADEPILARAASHLLNDPIEWSLLDEGEHLAVEELSLLDDLDSIGEAEISAIGQKIEAMSLELTDGLLAG